MPYVDMSDFMLPQLRTEGALNKKVLERIKKAGYSFIFFSDVKLYSKREDGMEVAIEQTIVRKTGSKSVEDRWMLVRVGLWGQENITILDKKTGRLSVEDNKIATPSPWERSLVYRMDSKNEEYLVWTGYTSELIKALKTKKSASEIFRDVLPGKDACRKSIWKIDEKLIREKDGMMDDIRFDFETYKCKCGKETIVAHKYPDNKKCRDCKSELTDKVDHRDVIEQFKDIPKLNSRAFRIFTFGS